MFVLSSPSGAGKTTLLRMLIERVAGLQMSVSATTRAMRPGEVDGRDYLFVDKAKFEAMANSGELLESVARCAAGLRRLGITRGDRVVAYTPNIPETLIAFLAAASLGAIWSSCAPEFGTRSVIDRFAQLEPAALFVVDGQEQVTDPVGMFGSRLDVDTHIVTGSATAIQNLTQCIEGAGVQVEAVIFSPLAAAEAVLEEEEKRQGVILADIGGGTTEIAVFVEGSVFHTCVLPVGGYHLTHDLVAGLRRDPAQPADE